MKPNNTGRPMVEFTVKFAPRKNRNSFQPHSLAGRALAFIISRGGEVHINDLERFFGNKFNESKVKKTYISRRSQMRGAVQKLEKWGWVVRKNITSLYTKEHIARKKVVIAALKSGMATREIGLALGVSGQRVSQIAKRK